MRHRAEHLSAGQSPHLSPRHPSRRVLVPVCTALLVVAGAAVFAVTQGHPVRWLHPVPTSIPADGSADVTQQLNDFIASVPSGTAGRSSVIRFQAGGHYRSEGTLRIRGKRHLEIDGNGATIYATTIKGTGCGWPECPHGTHRAHVQLGSGTHFLRIHDLRIRGPFTGEYPPGAAYEGQSGIRLHGDNATDDISHIKIDHNDVRNVFGEWVYLHGVGRHVEVHDNVFRMAGRQGMAMVALFGRGRIHDVLYEHNDMSGVPSGSLFDCENGRGTVEHVRFADNRIGSYGAYFSVATGEGACNDFTFARNIVRQASMRGYISSAPKAFGGAHRRWTFEDNVAGSEYIGWGGNHMFVLRDVREISFRGNSFKFAAGWGNLSFASIGGGTGAVRVIGNRLCGLQGQVYDVTDGSDLQEWGNTRSC
jgi:hypothetical protein